MDKGNNPPGSEVKDEEVEIETEPTVDHETIVHSAECLPTVSKVYAITWIIKNIDSITDLTTLCSKKFPEDLNCERFFVQMFYDRVENTLVFTFYKCGGTDKKLEGVSEMLEHRPVVIFDGEEEVEGKFNDNSDVVIEMTDDWRENFMEDGELTVVCSVREPKPRVDVKLGSLSDIISEMEMMSDISGLQRSGYNYDLVVKSKDNQVGWIAHKLIFSVRCPVFKKQLASLKDSADIQIPYVDNTTLGLMYYIYRGRCADKHLTFDTIAAADEYALPGLKQMAENYLSKTLDNDNVLQHLVKSISFNAIYLQQACLQYIITQKLSKTITNSNQWEKLNNSVKLTILSKLLLL